MPSIGTEKDAFSRMDVAFIWSHECPAGCEKTGRTTIFHSFLRTKKLPCLCQLSTCVLHFGAFFFFTFTRRKNENNVQEIKKKYNVTAFTTN